MSIKENPIFRTIFVFGTLSICLFALFELSKLAINIESIHTDVYIAIIGVIFIGVGILMNRFWLSGEHYKKPLEVDLSTAYRKVGLSDREYEVLTQVSKGLSNQEISQQLHISENTVKTHVSNLLSKLNAKRRTQAVQIARDLEII